MCTEDRVLMRFPSNAVRVSVQRLNRFCNPSDEDVTQIYVSARKGHEDMYI